MDQHGFSNGTLPEYPSFLHGDKYREFKKKYPIIIDRQRLQELDVLSRRYGALRSTIINLSLRDYDLVRLTACVGLEEVKKQYDKQMREIKRNRSRG